MGDFERYIEAELRRLLSAVVSAPPPLRRAVKRRGPFPARGPQTLQLSPTAARVLEPAAAHAQGAPLGEA